MILATCASLAAVLASAKGGAVVQLSGTCGPIEVAREFAAPVTIDASRARVRGLVLSGRNIVWKGGWLTATDGMAGKGPRGYAARITGTGITLRDATLTDARMGLVIHRASDVTVRANRFWRLRSDGINVAQSMKLTISNNDFSETLPIAGDHADAIQMRDGVRDVLIEGNTVRGDTQGIGQMDKKDDAPLERVVVRDNDVAIEQYHTITLGACRDCRIEDNRVRRGRTDRKAVIRSGEAVRCGNAASDDKGEKRCR